MWIYSKTWEHSLWTSVFFTFTHNLIANRNQNNPKLMFNLHFILVWSYILYLIIYITTKSILKDYRRCFHRWWTIKLSNIYFEGYPLIVLHLLKNNVVHVVLTIENPPGWFVNLNKTCYEHLLVLPWSFKNVRTNIFTAYILHVYIISV